MSVKNIAIVGLGYVGLPLAVEFSKHFRVIGFDISKQRIYQLNNLDDVEDDICHVTRSDLRRAGNILFTDDISDIADADVIIVCVPTPVDNANTPDMTPLILACQLIAPHLKNHCTVVFESTVYPGATEEICIPTIEKFSKHKWGVDLNIGYSPERINPGDKDHCLADIVKIISADSDKTLAILSDIYTKIIKAGVYKANSIKIAEAAKVIENTQRDINIALINECAIIFDKLGISTKEVIDAASTKWNFIPFKPGLVGGHCIGVDPYYLTHKAEMIGYHPQVILSGRRINDEMHKHISQVIIKKMNNKKISAGTIVIFGVSFKENCPDIRNSKVFDLIAELESYGLKIVIHDPVVDSRYVHDENNMRIFKFNELPLNPDGVIIAVPHAEFKDNIYRYIQSCSEDLLIFDIKNVYYESMKHKNNYWSL